MRLSSMADVKEKELTLEDVKKAFPGLSSRLMRNTLRHAGVASKETLVTKLKFGDGIACYNVGPSKLKELEEICGFELSLITDHVDGYGRRIKRIYAKSRLED